MKQDVKEKWISDLRSGNYKQAQQSLRNREGYCCLGVLCESMGYKDWKDAGEDDYSLRGFYHKGEDNVYITGDLNEQLLEEAGLTRKDTQQLITLNDTDNYTFEDIATYVEEKL
jgi:hypothetical protein